MTYHVVIHDHARTGITEAYDWLAENAPEVAEQWLDGLERAVASLDTLPARCPIAPESKLGGKEIRSRLYGRGRNRYRILFIIRDQTVHVIEVRHGSRRPLTAKDLRLTLEAEDESAPPTDPDAE